MFKILVHVFKESQRVYQFKEACQAGGEGMFEKLGLFMNESQTSCRDLFECSCLELDELTDIARSAGAFGSRLTGAGW